MPRRARQQRQTRCRPHPRTRLVGRSSSLDTPRSAHSRTPHPWVHTNRDARRFYQHLPEGCEWAFGLVWGHAVSTDLVNWHQLPHALEPTPGSLDADGGSPPHAARPLSPRLQAGGPELLTCSFHQPGGPLPDPRPGLNGQPSHLQPDPINPLVSITSRTRRPTPPGCFSGCATVDTDGRPVILYTGVRLRTNTTVGPLPPPDRDLHLPFIESQIAAVPADPGAAACLRVLSFIL
jgi:hypothetical protein